MKSVETKDFVPLSEIKTVVKDGLSRLVEPETVKESLLAIANTIPDDLEVTPETLTVSRGKLSEIRQARYALQNIEKENTSTLNKLKNDNKSYFAELIDIIKPKEDLLKDAIKEVEDEKKRIKEEKAEAEKKRVAAIRDDVMDKTNKIVDLTAKARSVEDLDKLEGLIKKLDEEWLLSLQEYEYMGTTLIDQANGYFCRASENVKSFMETQRLKEEAEKREAEIAAKQKEDKEKARLENERRLKELEAEKKAKEEAEAKLKAIEEAEKKKEEERKYLTAANKEAQNLHKELTSLGVKVTKPKRATDISVIDTLNATLRDKIDKENSKRQAKAWKESLKVLKKKYGGDLGKMSQLGAVTFDLMLKDNDCPQVLKNYMETILESIDEAKNFISGK